MNQWEINWIDDNDKQWFPYDDVVSIAYYYIAKNETFYYIAKNETFYYIAENETFYYIAEDGDMSIFKGPTPINLQAGDKDVGYMFHLNTCTSESSNDGKIPYGATITSVVATARNSAGDIDTELITSTTLSSPDTTLTLSYPISNGLGRYKITFIFVMSDGSEREMDFPSVYAKDV